MKKRLLVLVVATLFVVLTLGMIGNNLREDASDVAATREEVRRDRDPAPSNPGLESGPATSGSAEGAEENGSARAVAIEGDGEIDSRLSSDLPFVDRGEAETEIVIPDEHESPPAAKPHPPLARIGTQARWTTTQPVLAVAIHPDGHQILTGGDANALQLWDVATGRVLKRLPECEDAISDAAYDDSGLLALSGGYDGTCRLYDVAAGVQVRVLRKGSGTVYQVQFDTTGKLALMAGSFDVVELRDVKTGKCVRTFAESTTAYGAALHPDGHLVATGNTDGIVRVWDASTGKQLREIQAHSGSADEVQFVAGRRLVSSGEDGKVKLWDLANGELVREWTSEGDRLPEMSAHPHRRHVATCGWLGLVRVIDVEEDEPVWTVKGHSDYAVAVSYTRDGERVVSTGRDGLVRVWNAETGEEIALAEDRREGHRGPVRALRFDPSGRLASGGADGFVKLWEVETGRWLWEVRAHDSDVNCLAISADGQWLLSGSRDKTAKLWDLENGTLVRTISGHEAEIVGLGFGSSDTLVIVADADGSVRFLERETGKVARTVALEGCRALAVSPDGDLLATLDGEHRTLVRDVATGDVRWPRPISSGGQTLAFSADGASLLAGSLRLAATTGSALEGYSPDFPKHVQATDAGQSRIVCGTGSDAVLALDLETGALVRRFDGHEGPVLSVAIGPHGRVAASGGKDSRILLWNLAGE